MTFFFSYNYLDMIMKIEIQELVFLHITASKGLLILKEEFALNSSCSYLGMHRRLLVVPAKGMAPRLSFSSGNILWGSFHFELQ